MILDGIVSLLMYFHFAYFFKWLNKSGDHHIFLLDYLLKEIEHVEYPSSVSGYFLSFSLIFFF